jgi:hyaluronan synthase
VPAHLAPPSVEEGAPVEQGTFAPEGETAPRSAYRVERGFPWLLVGGALVLLAWATYRLLALIVGGAPVLWVYLVCIGMLATQLLVAAFDRPRRAHGRHIARLEHAKVAVLAPVYNEDETVLRDALASLLRQTRPPDAVCVVDDGSTSGDYARVRDWFTVAGPAAGVAVTWQRQANAGKRHAQVAGARTCPDADLYVTIDSDTQLDPRAIAESLEPFADPKVQSVAGTVLVTNYDTNLMTRLQESWFASMQMVDRAFLSRLGSVLVNSGALATVRASVLWDNVDDYLGERLFGRPVMTSDDSLLTLYAQRAGRTVHQSSAFAFTQMPSTLGGHRRQQLRWMRGAFLRSGTRFEQLRVGSVGYWYHLGRWVQYAAATAVCVLLACSGALLRPGVWLMTALVVGAAQLLLAAPYLSVRRSDQSARQRWAVVACAPLVGWWRVTFLRVLRWYAMATFADVAWGTRKTVEVTGRRP